MPDFSGYPEGYRLPDVFPTIAAEDSPAEVAALRLRNVIGELLDLADRWPQDWTMTADQIDAFTETVEDRVAELRGREGTPRVLHKGGLIEAATAEQLRAAERAKADGGRPA